MNADIILRAAYRSQLNKLVAGLRDSAPPSECRVYRANPDGSRGKFLRIEEPNIIETTYNGRPTKR